LPSVRPMYPPSSSTPQPPAPIPTYPVSSSYEPPPSSAAPVPTYPVSSGYRSPVSTNITPSPVQPSSIPAPAGVATKSQQYPTSLSSKPASVIPPAGSVHNATVASNYAGSLSDGFNSMRLQVCIVIIIILTAIFKSE